MFSEVVCIQTPCAIVATCSVHVQLFLTLGSQLYADTATHKPNAWWMLLHETVFRVLGILSIHVEHLSLGQMCPGAWLKLSC